MPISAYYGGHGRQVMAEMVRQHGRKAGERMFYATAHAKGQTPKGTKRPKHTLLKGEHR